MGFLRGRPLAFAEGPDGRVDGTRAELVLTAGGSQRRIPWEQIASADWDSDEHTLRVVELVAWGETRPEHRLRLDQADRLLQLVRERITASIVIQRHVPVRARQEVRISGRRAPGTSGPIEWYVDYDLGLDPAADVVRRVAGEALAAARADVGE